MTATPSAHRAAPQADHPEGGEHDYQHLDALLAEFAGPDLSPERRRALRERLVIGFLPLVHSIARRYARRGVPFDDLVQVAAVGLIKAVDRFDPALSRMGFLPFAVPTVRGEIQRYFRDHTWSMRVPRRLKELTVAVTGATEELSSERGRAPRPSEIAARLGVPVADVLEALQASHEAYGSQSLDQHLYDGEPTSYSTLDVLGALDAKLMAVEDRTTLEALLADLPERERAILVLRFFDDLTQTQIAEHVGLSQMHVSRTLTRTLDRLHERSLDS
ncbi:MAG TPA: SigB/SigF/SigG family RNA polymerase sigma factor [Pseudonocardia sp.]